MILLLSNISVISWWSVLPEEETGVNSENCQNCHKVRQNFTYLRYIRYTSSTQKKPCAGKIQTLLHKLVLSTNQHGKELYSQL